MDNSIFTKITQITFMSNQWLIWKEKFNVAIKVQIKKATNTTKKEQKTQTKAQKSQ